MKNKTVFFTHTVALSTLFILGNAIISLPKNNADEFTFLGYLSACIISILLYFIVIPLSDIFFCDGIIANSKSFKKLFLCVVYLVVAICALWCSAHTFIDFINFARKIILPDMSKALIAITFLATVVFFILKRQENILKFTLIAFWFILIAIIFFWFATFENFNFRNIFIFRLPEINRLIKSTKEYIINPILPSMLLPIYIRILFNKKRSGNAFSGLLVGLCVLGVCILSALLLFGPHFAGRLDYPYSSAVSTVTVGRLFTRMDGFSYFIYFAASIVKINVCAFIVKICLKRINCCLN